MAGVMVANSVGGGWGEGLTAVELGTLKHNKKHAVFATWLSEVTVDPSPAGWLAGGRAGGTPR